MLPNLSFVKIHDETGTGLEWKKVLTDRWKMPKNKEILHKEKLSKHTPSEKMASTLGQFTRWYESSIEGDDYERIFYIGSHVVNVSNADVMPMLGSIFDIIYKALTTTEWLPCVTDFRKVSMDTLRVTNTIVDRTLLQIMEQVGLRAVVEAARYVEASFDAHLSELSRTSPFAENILNAATKLPSAFDRSSLGGVIKHMSAQQKCIMITSIVSMNDTVEFGFDFGRIETNLNTIVESFR